MTGTILWLLTLPCVLLALLLIGLPELPILQGALDWSPRTVPSKSSGSPGAGVERDSRFDAGGRLSGQSK